MIVLLPHVIDEPQEVEEPPSHPEPVVEAVVAAVVQAPPPASEFLMTQQRLAAINPERMSCPVQVGNRGRGGKKYQSGRGALSQH